MLRRTILATAAAFALAPVAFAGSMGGGKDIVETAADAGSFKTLLAAAEAAGLVGVLKSDGPLTVFAPTDEAFAKLPAGTVEMLLQPENRDKLAKILTYHVVPAKVMSSDIAAKTAEVLTAEGSRVYVDGRGGKVKVGGANVVAADIEASNGVIHVIDKVIMPGS